MKERAREEILIGGKKIQIYKKEIKL